jgi:cardiolipin synthase
LGAVLFLFLALSDALDGFLARILRAETLTGRVLDPLADKALLVSGLLTVTYIAPLRIDPTLLKVMVMRDVTLLTGSPLVMRLGFTPSPSLFGKTATVLVALTVLVAFLRNLGGFPGDGPALGLLYDLALLMVVVSWADYVLKGLRFLRDKLIMEKR